MTEKRLFGLTILDLRLLTYQMTEKYVIAKFQIDKMIKH